MKLRAGLAFFFFIIFIQSQPAMIQEPVTVSGKEAATLAESRAWKSGGDNEFYGFPLFDHQFRLVES